MRTLLILALGAATLATPVRAFADPRPSPAAESVARALHRARQDLGAPGMAVAVWSGGSIVAEAASGVRAAGSQDAVQTSDAFHIGSVTKSITAVLAARLVEEGRLRWDETVADRLGDAVPDISPDQRSVTLEMLLAHESGAPERLSPDQLRGVVQAPDLAAGRVAVARAVLASPPAGRRGVMVYSNPGYVIAGAMIERAGGRSWEDLVGEKVLVPLGLSSAGFGVPKGDGAVRGHRREGDAWGAIDPSGPAADNPPFLRPAGGLHMSMRDLALFGADQLNGVKGDAGALLTAASYARLHTEGSNHQGLGWAEGPDGSFDNSGSNGRWFAYIRVAPDSDLVVAVGANAFSPGMEERIVRLADEIRSLLGQR